ncbi:MAG: hydrogen peroxide-inducible genes activator [Gammaproteobacteria bacterium]|nr:MAG: hydrogen peroxide-inducible genes activator [Gammaproteobacteria bacterium]
MTLTELRYIVTLADVRHFGRAAEKCYVSQPTLSVAVKKLEEELGVSLFERSRGQVTVTDTGEQVIRQARKVLDQVRLIREIAQSGRDQLSSPLRLGAIYTVGPYLFPHLMPQLRREAPGMGLYIEEGYTSVLREKLRHGELDAIVIALPFEETEVLTKPLYDEPFVVLMPKDHPLAAEAEIDPAWLSQYDLLMLGPGHCFRDQVLQACPGLEDVVVRRAGAPEPGSVVTEGSSLETIRHMVASGLGITVLPQSAVQAGDDGGLLTTRPFRAPVPSRTVALAWRVTFPRPKAIDLLAKAAGQCKVNWARALKKTA